MIDVSTLKKASVKLGYHTSTEDFPNVWMAEAHGVLVEFQTFDYEADFYVSPIWNMRQKGVALVNKAGVMVKNERRDR